MGSLSAENPYPSADLWHACTAIDPHSMDGCGCAGRPAPRAAPHLGERHAVEVAQQAVGDGGAAAAGRPHGCHKLHVCQRAEGRVAAVPAALAQRLPQQLQRRLRARPRARWSVAHAGSRMQACMRSLMTPTTEPVFVGEIRHDTIRRYTFVW